MKLRADSEWAWAALLLLGGWAVVRSEWDDPHKLLSVENLLQNYDFVSTGPLKILFSSEFFKYLTGPFKT